MKSKHKLMLARLIIGATGLGACIFLKLDMPAKLFAFLAIYLVLGYDILIDAVKNVFTLRFLDENFLMAIASIGAFAIGEYPEAVSVMLFYQVGELFLDIAVNRSRKSISSLMELDVDYANRYTDGEVERISPYDLKVGEQILIKSGEKVPVDCVVVKGESTLDTAALTGESIPKMVNVGDDVLSGSVNISAGFIAEAKKEYVDSTAMKILELAENAAHKKAKTEKFITKFAKYYTPIVVILAICIVFIPYLITGNDFSLWLERGLSFLVVSCPCALVISVPMGFFAGVGSASARGCIVKGSVVLETLSKIKIAVFDKTGTLTNGKIRIKEFECDGNRDEILRLAAYAENFNNHPVGRAVVEYYGKAVDVSEVSDVKEIIGKGVGCTVEDHKVYVGNAALMAEVGISAEDNGDSVIYVAVDSVLMAKMTFGDEIKNNAKESLASLKKLGIKKTVMLTGDNEKNASVVFESLGMDEMHHSLLPTDKLRIVEELKTDENVIFVGDGINDSPVLAFADVGIAMGSNGSDAAIEAADIVIMNDDLSCINDVIKISRKTMRVVAENIIFSIGIKILVLVLCAVGIVGMWAAVFADVGVALLAVLNSLRCLKLTKNN